MIYTLTLNPAIDYFLDLGEELWGTVQGRGKRIECVNAFE